MTEKRHSPTGLLMTEIIIGLLFFSIAAACCLQVFAAASNRSYGAKQLKLAVNSTENLLQQIRAVQGEEEALEAFYPDADNFGEGRIFFDRVGSSCPESEKDYFLEFQIEKKEFVAEVEIVCYDKEETEIYRLDTSLVVEEHYEREG